MWRVGGPVFVKALDSGRSGGRTPRPPYKFYRTKKSNPGCHVAALHWATWHLSIRPHHATCHIIIRPTANEPQTATSSICPVSTANSAATSSRPRRLLTSACATCHPSSGDTCHFQIGQTVLRKCPKCMTRVTPRSCHVSCMVLPHHCTAATSAVRPATSAVRPAQSASKFCLFGPANRSR
jgi:hypothetical protein